MLRRGANINEKDDYGKTALYIASLNEKGGKQFRSLDLTRDYKGIINLLRSRGARE